MKRYVVTLLASILILACYNVAHGSSWSLMIGGSGDDVANAVQQTTDGGYIVAGHTDSFGAGSNDVWVIKLNANGSVAWQKTYGGSGNDYAYSIQQTSDGGFVVAGETYSFGSAGWDAWVLKLNADGSVAWQKTYGSQGPDSANFIQQTADGGYIVAGQMYAFDAGTFKAWILKLNVDGSVDWQKTYGEGIAKSTQQTADGGYIVAGQVFAFDVGHAEDAWVLKLNADGSVAWQKTYGGVGHDYANSIQQTVDGGYIVAGQTDSFGSGNVDAWILKLNADGSMAWQKTYGGAGYDYANSIQQTVDGGYIVAGKTDSFGAGSGDAWVLKLNADGSVVWQKTYGTATFNYANSIQQTADGGYIIAAGTTNLFGVGGSDAWVMKLDQKGGIMGCSAVAIAVSAVTVTSTSIVPVNSTAVPATTAIATSTMDIVPSNSNATAATNCSYTPSPSKWMKTYGGAADDAVFSVQQTADGGYIVAGFTGSFGAGWHDAWMLKLNADGSVAWQKTYGGSDYDYANFIQQTGDGGYIIAGNTYSFGAGGDAWVLKLNADGSVAWQKTYGGSGTDFANSIQQTIDGGYIVAGFTGSFDAGGYDAWVFKLNADGSVAWQKTYGGSNSEEATSIQQTADGGYIVAGYTASSGAGSKDAWVLKLNADGSVAWQKTYGGSSDDHAYSIQQTADGGYIVAGYKGVDAWVFKLNADGSVAWQKTFVATYGGSAYSIQQTADGGYIVAGRTDSAGDIDAWVLKLNADGSVAWQNTYGGSGWDYAKSIQQTADGGYIVAGYTNSFGSGGYDVWVLKLDQNGGITGCANVAASTASPQNSTGTVSSSSITPVSSSGIVASSTATVSSTSVTPGEICAASYTQYVLDVFLSGDGTGGVTSSPSGIDCQNSCFWGNFPWGAFGCVPTVIVCSYPFSSGSVTLTVAPAWSATFTGWSGDCDTSGQVTMNADKTCTANFSSPVDFSGIPRFGYAPLLVNFSGSSTNSPTLWAWNFGDSGLGGTGISTSHIYRTTGMFTVSLVAMGTGDALAKKVDYVTVAPCETDPARIAGPQYYGSVTAAYGNLGSSGSIDLQAMEFVENVDMSSAKTVTLIGGYPCDYGTPIADSEINGSLTIGGNSGPVTVDGIAIH